MRMFVENSSDSTLKKEFEKDRWITIGNLAVPYPYPYGFIQETMQKDGDPLDAFLITHSPTEINRGDILDVITLGMAEFSEDKNRDSKILVRKLSEKIELTEDIKNTVKYFLLHAFDNNPKKKIEFNGFYDSMKAQAEIENCRTGKDFK